MTSPAPAPTPTPTPSPEPENLSVPPEVLEKLGIKPAGPRVARPVAPKPEGGGGPGSVVYVKAPPSEGAAAAAPPPPKPARTPLARVARPGARISFSPTGDVEVSEQGEASAGASAVAPVAARPAAPAPPAPPGAPAARPAPAPAAPSPPSAPEPAPRAARPAPPPRTAAPAPPSPAASAAAAPTAGGNGGSPAARPPPARRDRTEPPERDAGMEVSALEAAPADEIAEELEDVDTSVLWNEPADGEEGAVAAALAAGDDDEDEQAEEEAYRRRLEDDERAGTPPLESGALEQRLEALTAEVGAIVRAIAAGAEEATASEEAAGEGPAARRGAVASAAPPAERKSKRDPRMRILDFEGNVIADSHAADEGAAAEEPPARALEAEEEEGEVSGEATIVTPADLAPEGEDEEAPGAPRPGSGTEAGVVGERTARTPVAEGQRLPEGTPTERFESRRRGGATALDRLSLEAGLGVRDDLRAAIGSPPLRDDQVDLLAAQWEAGPGRRTITAEELGLDPREYAGEKRPLFLFKLAVAATLLEAPGTVSSKLGLMDDLERARALDNVFALDWSLDRTLEELELLDPGRELSPLEERLVHLPRLKRALGGGGIDLLRRIEAAIGRRAAAIRAACGNSVGAGAYWIDREMRRLGLW